MTKSVAVLLAVSLAAPCCGLSGCASYGSHLAASPLPAGKRELSLNADVLVIDRGLGPQVLPNPEVGYRFGLGPELDLGGRLNAGSLEVNGRWRFARGVADLALVPGLGLGFVPVTNSDTGLFNAHLLASLLAGFHPSERSELVLGARGGVTYAFPKSLFAGDTSEDKLVYLAGGVLGVRFPVGARTYLFPELNLLFPYDTYWDEWNFPTFQGGIALQFE